MRRARQRMGIGDKVSMLPQVSTVERLQRAPVGDKVSMLPQVSTMERLRVSVVIPALNEAENLPSVLPRIPMWVHEVILVDGRSTDGTVEVARSLRPDIIIVHQEDEGKGAALRAGFEAASGDIIAMLDADGSTDPAELPVFVGALLAGADFVKGSRFVQGAGTADMSKHRRLGNWGFVRLVRLLFGGKFSDLCYGYNAFWKRELPLLHIDSKGFEVETVMNLHALRNGLKVVEVPSFEALRVHGKGRLQTFPDGWRVLKAIWRERAAVAVNCGWSTILAPASCPLKMSPWEYGQGDGDIEKGRSRSERWFWGRWTGGIWRRWTLRVTESLDSDTAVAVNPGLPNQQRPGDRIVRGPFGNRNRTAGPGKEA